MYGEGDGDVNSEVKYQARRRNIEQARALGFNDLSPQGFYDTDCGEHVAVCDRCAALVHYPLSVDTSWPPETQYVKSTDTLRKHLRSVHSIVVEASDE